MVEKIIETMNEAVNSVYQEFAKAYKQLVSASHMDALKNLKAGDIAPAENDLLPAYQDQLTQLVQEYRSKALKSVTDARNEIVALMAADPSEEALRALTAFQMACPDEKIENNSSERERIADEIDVLMSVYDNYLIYEALRSLAKKAGILDFKKHPVDVALDDIKYAERFITKEIGSAIRNHDSSVNPNHYRDSLAMRGMLG